MPRRKLTATALVTRNSLNYIENVFALNAVRQPFVNVPDEAFANTLSGIDIDRCIVPNEGSGWFADSHQLIRDDQPAQVTYTSGTEGKPKGIVLTYSNLADAAARIIDQMGLTSEVREYVGVPVNYSFGIGRIRSVSAAGGQSYLPPRGFDPLELSRMLNSGDVNALSAVPTLLRIVLQSPSVIGEAGKNLRWLEIGSQYMSGAEKRSVRELFPNARIVQHYGLTEASRSTFLQISDVPDDVLESVGKAVGKTEVEISGEGRIRLRGPHIARWRVDADHLVDLTGADGWLETSDLGHIKDGYLYYDGRADDLINTGGVKVNPDKLEARIGRLLGQAGNIVVTKVPDALRGEGVLVAADSVDLPLNRLRSAAAKALQELGLHAGDALHVKIISEIPRTATGKPLRRLVAEQFLEQNNTAALKSMDKKETASTPGDVMAFFRDFFPGQEVQQEDSFETMGGDSLSYIQFSMGFENTLGSLPSGWENLSVTQLQRSLGAGRRGSWRQLESPTLTRAFFMICIVALHLDTFVYSSNWGAAYFLFMLCGYSVMRFQWPEIRRTNKITTLLGTVLRVAIPTIMVVVVMQLLARTFELKPLLLISNWFDPHEYHIAYYYFAEIYMQLLLVVAVILSFPSVRNMLRTNPMLTCIGFIVTAMVVSWLSEMVWDTNYIFHRTPIWYFWTVGAGMLMASVRGLRDRLLAMAVVVVAVLLHHGFTSGSAYILGGSALLLFLPELTVPYSAKVIFAEIAGSSMFIYLSHYQVKSLITRLFHGPMPWLALFAAIGFGIVSARLYSWIEGKVLAVLRTRGLAGFGGGP